MKLLITKLITSILFLALFPLVLIASCGPSKQEMEEKYDKGYDWVDGNWIKRDSTQATDFLSDDIRIKTIEGHQYIVLKENGRSGDNAGILHSESCTNQKHLTQP